MKSNLNSGIYKITNPKDRVYIGQTKNLHKRLLDYLRVDSKIKSQIKIYNSIMKYGIENHVFQVLEECAVEILNKRERYWQDFYEVLGEKGLNCMLQESDEKPRVCSEETRKKISDATKGEKNGFYGKTHTEESKVKLSNSLKGKSSGGRNRSARLVLCIESGVFFDTIKEASEARMMDVNVLASMLRGDRENKTNLIYA